MSQPAIKAIDSTSVHRITSGQVVIDLQTAVKELVENSLDAGATTIDVRFKDYGLKSIEVIDNGHGVAPEDYDSLALKHHTSKLASFDDLGTVLTFGFRGEALSSLCALSSSVAVVTATAAQAPMGTVLNFDRSGKVMDKIGKVARQRGTSVTITGLFAPLPVRRKELEKNAKREYGKALNLLQAYALVPCANENRGVRLTVSNHPTKGARSVQIRTEGSPSTRTSVSSLWGPKSLDNLVVLDLNFDVESERSSVLKKRGIRQEGATRVKVRGLISKFAPGCGRTSNDRQFFYVNGRPCSPHKVQKTFNEVYRSFNANQVPFVIADFQLPTTACDINVSPDKRTIFIHSENNLVQTLKTSLEETFSSSRSTFSINGASRGKATTGRQRSGTGRGSSPVSDGERSREGNDADQDESADLQEEVDVEDGDSSSNNRGQVTQNGRSSEQEKAGVDERSFRKTPILDASRTSTARSQLSNAGSDIDYAEPRNPTPEQEDVEMGAENEDGVVAGVPNPNTSLPCEADEETASQRESDLQDRSDAGSEPRASPIPPSPTSALIRQPLGFRTSSVGSAPSPLLHSSDPDEPEERPRKRQRISSLTLVPLTAKSRPMRIILDTPRAPWNSEVQSRRGSKALDARETTIERGTSTASGARDRLKSQLAGFSAPGNQMVPIEVEEKDLPGDDREAEEVMEVKGLEHHEDQERPEKQAEIDELVNEEPLNRTSDAGRITIDLTDDLADEAVGRSGLAPRDLGESTEDCVPCEEIVRTSTRDVTLRLDLERLSSTWSRVSSGDCLDPSPPSIPSPSGHLQPSANVTNADDAEAAERELSRVIHKEDFSSMHILGQFNLGFIITRRTTLGNEKGGADDLFIVDQHAADEKYNFETLQQTTKIESQKLFQPRSLDLTAADELMAIDNVGILRANGFEVMIDEDAHAGQGQRIKLVSQPVSKGTTFDMKDLEELLHLMQDQPVGHMVRCSKARAMFAMRACRKSVMVGKALTTSQMTSVVRHMGTMDQPWNCPHGRPTMRHLVSLSRMERSDRRDWNVDWTKFTSAA